MEIILGKIIQQVLYMTHWKAVVCNTSTNAHRTPRTKCKVRHTGQEKNRAENERQLLKIGKEILENNLSFVSRNIDQQLLKQLLRRKSCNMTVHNVGTSKT